MSCIKSIQSGIDEIAGKSSTVSNITINAVNIDKSFVLLHSQTTIPYPDMYYPIGVLTSPTTLKLSSISTVNTVNSGNTFRTMWQVIEFA